MKPHEIKELRLKEKLTQEALGGLCGVGKSAVSNWEKGTTSPSGAALLILDRLRSGETVVSQISDLELKLLDQNVDAGGFRTREDYLTRSLKYLITNGKFLDLPEPTSNRQDDKARNTVEIFNPQMAAEDDPAYPAATRKSSDSKNA